MSSWTDNTPIGNPVGRNALGFVTTVMAGSLLVFFRRDIGARLLVRRWFMVAAALLIGLANLEKPFDRPLASFAVAFTLLVFIHHWRHMRRIKRGSPEWHSYDTGRSLLFSWVPFLPRWLAQVFIEPVLCWVLGYWLLQRGNYTFYIAWWIMLASFTLFSLENKIRIARHEGLFDLGDTVIESMDFARRAENFTKRPQEAARSASRRSRNPLKAWFLAYWEAARAAQEARRAQREEAEGRKRDSEEGEPGGRQQEEHAQYAWSDPTAGHMTPEQAFEILELKPGATAAEIRAAYNRLMQKVHPDMGGSTFFAKQLNLARDALLRPQRRAR
jgi:DnaJ-domain-containing protein 1